VMPMPVVDAQPKATDSIGHAIFHPRESGESNGQVSICS